MLFVDTNIFMYATGGDHPHKIPSVRFFESVAAGKEKIAIDAEVLQEILYRFWFIKKIDRGFELFEYAQALCDWVFPISQGTIKRAKELMTQMRSLGPRDALHVASMQENRISTIVSYDHDFDSIRQIKRIEPAAI